MEPLDTDRLLAFYDRMGFRDLKRRVEGRLRGTKPRRPASSYSKRPKVQVPKPETSTSTTTTTTPSVPVVPTSSTPTVDFKSNSRAAQRQAEIEAAAIRKQEKKDAAEALARIRKQQLEEKNAAIP